MLILWPKCKINTRMSDIMTKEQTLCV